MAEAEAELPATAEAEAPSECIGLPPVNNRNQTHNVQPWHQMDVACTVKAKLKGTWNDQGWGNRKGAIHARVVTPDGSVIFPWRRIGPYPAPHCETKFDIDIPTEFFATRLSAARLRVEEGTGQDIMIPADDPAAVIATATYGNGDNQQDVLEIVKRELAAGKKVFATNDLFGDPCPFIVKSLTVTLIDGCRAEKAMPDDARLELGFEVGDGGGHSLRIWNACLYPEKIVTVLTATFDPPNITLFTMAGETFATIGDVPAENSEEALAEQIRAAVREQVIHGDFKVIVAGTNQVISG